MSSKCFQPEDPFSGRRLYKQVWYSVFQHTLLPTKLLIPMHVKRTMSQLYINRLPEDEPRLRNM